MLQALRCYQTTMTYDQNVVLINNKRLSKSELLDRLHHVLDLPFIVFLCILHIRLYVFDFYIFNVHLPLSL